MNEFASVKYYTELFGDIIADIQHDRPEDSDNLIAGFRQALNDWRQYHVNQIAELDRVDSKLNDKI
jgi:hypothetical protein